MEVPAIDTYGIIVALASIVLVVVFISIPVALAVGAFMLGKRHLEGRRTKYDRLFEGLGRANAMRSHLGAGTPDPDALAVPLPDATPTPGRRRRSRLPKDD